MVYIQVYTLDTHINVYGIKCLSSVVRGYGSWQIYCIFVMAILGFSAVSQLAVKRAEEAGVSDRTGR